MCVSPLLWSRRALSLSLSTLFLSQSLSLSLSQSLSLSVSVACRDTTVMISCDMLSLPLFWSPYVSFCSRRSLSFFLSFFPQSRICLFLSFSSLSVACRVTTVIPPWWYAATCFFYLSFCPDVSSLFLESTRALSLSLSTLFLSQSLSLSLGLLVSVTCRVITVMISCDRLSLLLFWSAHVSSLSRLVFQSQSLFHLIICLSLFSFALCSLSPHHSDTTVVVRRDRLSLPLFWSPHMPPLFLQSTRALSLFLSQSLSFSLSLSLSVSLSVTCRITTVAPL